MRAIQLIRVQIRIRSVLNKSARQVVDELLLVGCARLSDEIDAMVEQVVGDEDILFIVVCEAVVGVVQVVGDEVNETWLDEVVLFELARGAEEAGGKDPLGDESFDQTWVYRWHRIWKENEYVC